MSEVHVCYRLYVTTVNYRICIILYLKYSKRVWLTMIAFFLATKFMSEMFNLHLLSFTFQRLAVRT